MFIFRFFQWLSLFFDKEKEEYKKEQKKKEEQSISDSGICYALGEKN